MVSHHMVKFLGLLGLKNLGQKETRKTLQNVTLPRLGNILKAPWLIVTMLLDIASCYI
jgi:hypothetical protein